MLVRSAVYLGVHFCSAPNNIVRTADPVGPIFGIDADYRNSSDVPFGERVTGEVEDLVDHRDKRILPTCRHQRPQSFDRSWSKFTINVFSFAGQPLAASRPRRRLEGD